MHHVAWHVDRADAQRMNVRPTPDLAVCRAFGSTRCWTRSRDSWRSHSTRSRARLIARRSSHTGNGWRVCAIMLHASGCRLPVGSGSRLAHGWCGTAPAATRAVVRCMLHVALYVACCLLAYGIVCCMHVSYCLLTGRSCLATTGCSARRKRRFWAMWRLCSNSWAGWTRHGSISSHSRLAASLTGTFSQRPSTPSFHASAVLP
jgi:hypothetical protein